MSHINPLRDVGSQYKAIIINNLYGLIKFIYYIFMCLKHYCALSHFKEKNKNVLILDFDDQNTTYVFASKGAHVPHLSLNLQEHQSV